MKDNKLIDALNDIDEKYIVEAHEVEEKQSIIHKYWKPVCITAMCTCMAFMFLPKVLFNTSYDNGGYTLNKSESASKEYISEDLIMEEVETGTTNYKNSQKQSKLIITSTIEMETLNLDEVIQKINTFTKSNDGYTQYSNIYKDYLNQRIYSATIRVPSESFDQYIVSIKELANVTSYSQSVDDITEEYFDIEARIDSLEAEKKRVTEFYEKAQTVEELTTVEQRLSEIDYELNSYKNQKKNFDTLTNYSTLNIYVQETKVYTETKDDFGSRFLFALENGWTNCVQTLQNVVLSLVYNIWLIVLIVFACFVGYKIYKRFKK
ncbi:MAG: DUF4349 domain-containing protein [Bacillota bacterium]|nr:DUF4349 domain-containing protein [Bacillota bacterium]